MRVPELIQPLLNEYLTLVQRELPDLMIGLYLVGSIALDAFNARYSDIDFTTIVSRPCTEMDVERLARIHHQIATNYPRWPLQGSYLQQHNLGHLGKISPPYPFYSDGALHTKTPHEEDSVTWWILKTIELAIFGPELPPFNVDWDALIEKMHENLNSYWKSFTMNPRRMAWLLTDYGVQWAVLGVLRQFYTFEENDIISKTGAGEYALKHLPVRWHSLIREAINIREQSGETRHKFKIARAIEAVRFLKYVIALCNSESTVVQSGN